MSSRQERLTVGGERVAMGSGAGGKGGVEFGKDFVED